MGSMKHRILALVLMLLGWTSRPVSAQTVHLSVNSELEEYLRFAQTISSLQPVPWSIRGFSVKQESTVVAAPAVHPWQQRQEFFRPRTNGVRILPISAAAIFNSAFPFGSNDGAVWAGKGLTTVFQAGIAGKWGPLSATIAPLFFRAENSAFTLMENGKTGKLQFADGQFPEVIDRPQRFGAGAYQLVSPGQSTIRLDGFGATIGVSTANQAWGPATRYPFILGNNASGYPHVFLGTESPLNIGIGAVQGRAVWGMLEQSAFSPVGGPQYFVDGIESGRRRFTAGIVATFQPRGVTGLELGAGRFFHRAWPEGGPRTGDFTSLFQNIFKRGLPTEVSLPGSENTKGVRDNQLFSLFVRWVVPGTGFEAYGEFGREDHSWDIRDFILEPDHGGASRMVGVRKMWPNGLALRTEVINYQAPQLTRLRPEGAVYVHYVLRQGHTVKGQPLGADVGVGSGAGAMLAFDKYAASGRNTIMWERSLGRDRGRFYLTDVPMDEAPDVRQTLSLETVRFGKPFDVTAKVGATMNFNRNFSSDVFNLNVQVGTSYRF